MPLFRRWKICTREWSCLKIVTNITNFGAFVDIGVHQDGLVHISQLADKYVSDPTQVVRLHQHIKVRVLEVDQRRHRISLSMKGVSQ